MEGKKQIKTALISVFHKDGLEDLLKKLNDEGVKFLSTGGTHVFIESLGYECESVESLTTYPSIRAQMDLYEIPEIDLVVVDLYPFEDTVASGADFQDIIEKIDIGGISLIRAGAKNFNDVVILSSKDQYAVLLDILNRRGAYTTEAERRGFAEQAFAVTSHYDTAIHDWFASVAEK